MPISQEGRKCQNSKEGLCSWGHYAKITKRERVQEGVIAKIAKEGVIVLVGDYSRGCTCQALQEG